MSAPRKVAVVGAGVVGLSCALALADRGVEPVIFDPRPGHGASGGDGRIFRGRHADPALTELALHARVGWDLWQRRWDIPLLRDVGRLVVDGDSEHVDLTGALIDSRRVVAHLRAELDRYLRRARVLRITPRRSGADIHCEQGSVRVDAVAVCAGAASVALLEPLGVTLKLTEHLHLRVTCLSDSVRPILSVAGPGRRPLYGLPAPSAPGRYALGAGALEDLLPLAPGQVTVKSSYLTVERKRLRAEASQLGLGPIVATEVCRAVVADGPHPDHIEWAGVLDAPVAAVAGHNLFKFAPALGTRLADAVIPAMDGVRAWNDTRAA